MAVEMQRNTPEPWVSRGTQALEMPLLDAKRLGQVIIRRHMERKVRKPRQEDTVLTRAHSPSCVGWSSRPTKSLCISTELLATFTHHMLCVDTLLSLLKSVTVLEQISNFHFCKTFFFLNIYGSLYNIFFINGWRDYQEVAVGGGGSTITF